MRKFYLRQNCALQSFKNADIDQSILNKFAFLKYSKQLISFIIADINV
jgi:hypothetical protein